MYLKKSSLASRHKTHHRILPLILVKATHSDTNTHLNEKEQTSQYSDSCSAGLLEKSVSRAPQAVEGGRVRWISGPGALPQRVRLVGLLERYTLSM